MGVLRFICNDNFLNRDLGGHAKRELEEVLAKWKESQMAGLDLQEKGLVKIRVAPTCLQSMRPGTSTMID